MSHSLRILLVAVLLLGRAEGQTLSWSTGPSLPVTRAEGAVAVLDGKLYYCGGYEADVFNPSGNLYVLDSPTDTSWAQLASMPTARYGLALVAAEGKLYAIGGANSSSTQFDTIEVYDPGQNNWTTNGNWFINEARRYPAAVYSNGRIFYAGGNKFGGPNPVDTMYSFEPADPSNSLHATHSVLPNGGATNLLAHGNRLFALGRFVGNNSFDTVFSWAPSAVSTGPGTWTTEANPVPNPASRRAAVRLGEFFYVIAGGNSSFNQAAVDRFDPVARTWSQAVPANLSRHGASAAAYGNQIFVVGGSSGITAPGNVTGAVEKASLQPPSPGEFHPAPLQALKNARTRHGAIALNDGSLLALGGRTQPLSGSLSTAETLASSTASWQFTVNNLPLAVYDPRPALLPDGRVVIPGGRSDADPINNVIFYSPGNRQFSSAAFTLSNPRAEHAVTRLADGRVLISGGNIKPSTFEVISNTLEVISTGPDAATPLNETLPETRHSHTATLLHDGRVLIAGGTGSGGVLNTCRVYNPATGQVINVASMTQRRSGHSAVVLNDGSVLVGGGVPIADAGGSGPELELYDPAAGKWISIAGGTRRINASLSLLPSGDVLVIGGETPAATPAKLNSIDRVQVAARSASTLTGNLQVAITSHRSLPLANTDAVVIGGSKDQGAGSTAAADVQAILPGPQPNRPPNAIAPVSLTAQRRQTVFLNGSGSNDPDLDSLTYSWSPLGGNPSSVTLANSNSATASFSTAISGTYLFKLTVTDPDGLTGTTSTGVTIENNKTPVASAGQSQASASGGVFSLNGSGSFDPDGDALTFQWTQVSGTATTITNATSAVASVSLPNGQESRTFQLRVTDALGASSTALTTVSITTNRLPVANAGADQTVRLRAGPPFEIRLLDGRASSDPDGDTLSYSWRLTRGPAVGIQDTTSAVARIQPTTIGEYVFELTVNDGRGLSASATTRVTATPFNRAPVPVPGQNQNVGVDAIVRLDGSASFDPDGDPLSYSWTQTAGPAFPPLSAPSAPVTTFRANAAGTYTFELAVTDNRQATNRARVEVTAVVGNRPPSAQAGPDTTAVVNAEVVLDGSRSNDPDGDILTYRWTQRQGPPVNTADPGRGPMFRFAASDVGRLQFTLSVSDGRNPTATDDVFVDIVSGNAPPVSIPGADIGDARPNVLVRLDGSRSFDPDTGDRIVVYEWTFFRTPGGAPPLTGANTPFLSFTPVDVGVYELILRVQDSRGVSSRRGVQVIVGGGNRAPKADAGEDRTVPIGRETIFSGLRSTDPDGDPLTFRWRQLPGGPSLALLDASSPSVRFTPTVSGTSTLELTVSDGRGGTSTDTVLVISVPANQIPTGVAGGVWRRVSDIPTPRRLFAAVALRGKIYTFGGSRDGDQRPVGTVEVFDPIAGEFGAWTAAPSMPTPRIGATAVAVGTRIFVIGGRTVALDQASDTGVVEIFDTITQSWSAGPPLITARRGAGAAVLDTKIFAVGGVVSTGSTTLPTAIVERLDPLDPRSGWKLDTPLPSPRRPALATLNGRIFVIGGETSGNVGSGSVLIFSQRFPTPQDPFVSGGRWDTTTATRSTLTIGHAAAALGDFIFVAGGRVGQQATSLVERYDVGRDRFEPVPSMSFQRYDLQLVNLNGSLYALGGAFRDRLGTERSAPLVERFDAGDDHADSIAAIEGKDVIPIGPPEDAAIERGGDVDFFRFETTGNNQTLRVGTGPSDSFEDTVLSIFDGTGRRLVTVDDPAPGTRLAAATFVATAPGQYFASVRLFDVRQQAPYTISIRPDVAVVDDHPNGPTQAVTSVALGSSVTGTLETARDVDFFQVSLDAGRDYIFRTSLGTLSDTVLALFGPGSANPVPVRENDDGPDGSLASRIDFTPSISGTYFLRVRSFDPRASGTYSVQAERLPGDIAGDDHPNRASGFDSDDTLTHQGNTLNGVFQSETDVDYFRIVTQVNSAYAFVATPTNGRSVQLTLFDRDGLSVLSDTRDTGATGSTADIRGFRPSVAGTYFLRVQRAPKVDGDTTATLGGTYTLQSQLEGTETPASITLARQVNDDGGVTATVVLNSLPSDQQSLQSAEFGLVYDPRLLEPVSVQAGTATTSGQLLRFASPSGFLGFAVITQEQELTQTGSLVSVTFRSLRSSSLTSHSVILGFVATASGLTRSRDIAPEANPGVNQALEVRTRNGSLLPTIIDPTLPLSDNRRAWVRLDGRRSGDPNVPPRELSYSWTVTTAPAAVTLSDPASPIPTFAPTVPGVYEFALTVSNDTLPSLPRAVRVRVGFGNRPPTALFQIVNTTRSTRSVPDGSPLTAAAGLDSVQLDGRLSVDPDLADRGRLTYQWTQVTGPTVTLLPSATASVVTFLPTTAALYEFELKVRDTSGAESSSLRARVVVLSPADSLPAVSVSASASTTVSTGSDLGELLESVSSNSLRVRLPTRVTIKAKVADPDLGVLPLKQMASYVFSQESGPPVQLSTSGLDFDVLGVATTTFEPTTAGVHVFSVVVSSLTSAGVATGVEIRRFIRVVVDSTDISLPVARASIVVPGRGKRYAGRRNATDTVATAGETIQLDGSQSSSLTSSSDLTALWSQIAGPDVTLSDPFSTVTSFVAPDFDDDTTRNYAFQLIVDDGSGLSEPAIVSFNVAGTSATGLTSVTVVYGGGLSLVGMPLGAATTGASRMGQELIDDVGATFVIRTVATGGRNQLVLYTSGLGLTDEALQGNQGYIISRPSIFKSQIFTGQPWPDSARTITLLPGINLVSFPSGVPSTWTAQTLIDHVNASNAGATFVARTLPDPADVTSDNPGTGSFQVYLPGLGGTPFSLKTGRGYLLRVLRETTVTLPAGQ